MLIPLLFAALLQISNYAPVTKEMMLNPSPDDWLMMSRTYDEQPLRTTPTLLPTKERQRLVQHWEEQSLHFA